MPGLHVTADTSVLSARSTALPSFDRVLVTCALRLCVAFILLRLVLVVMGFPTTFLPIRFIDGFDGPALAILVMTLLALRYVTLDVSRPLRTLDAHALPAVAALAASVAVIGTAGATLVMMGFTPSRDEALAVTDAEVFAAGHLLAPVDPQWRPYLRTLQMLFTQFALDNSYWTSGYFPINALARALFVKFDIGALASPLFAALSVMLTYAIGRRLWPDRRDAALIAAIILAVSPQMLMTAMTPYAMTLHMLLTLLWLHFWLRNDARGHAGAIATGFFAVGIHQIVFHPLFAAPFILSFLLDRRWRLAAVYIASYLAIAAFWISYWPLVADAYGVVLDRGTSAGGVAAIVDRALHVLRQFTLFGLVAIPLNLLKMAAWQHILVVPLLLVAVWSLRQMPRPLLLSAYGVGLTLLLLIALMHDQGHGWGYRYLHGFLGPMALAAAFGWIQLTRHTLAVDRTRDMSRFVIATAVTLLVTLPMLALKVRGFIAPYGVAIAAIERSGADVVIVDGYGSLHLDDFQMNNAFLTNRIKVMPLVALKDDQLSQLCRTYKVAIFAEPQWRALGLVAHERSINRDVERVMNERLTMLRQLGCSREVSLTASSK